MCSKGITVDLVPTDPPYNLNKDFGNNSDKLSLDKFLEISKKKNRVMPRFTNTNRQFNMVWDSPLHRFYTVNHV